MHVMNRPRRALSQRERPYGVAVKGGALMSYTFLCCQIILKKVGGATGGAASDVLGSSMAEATVVTGETNNGITSAQVAGIIK
jgi:hypothetical protein